jgi:hypothetical protein
MGSTRNQCGRTTKQTPNRSTDQSGGKRRAVIFRLSRHLALNKALALHKPRTIVGWGAYANYFALSDSDLSGL